ncbi:MAG: class I SAM-dependent methyltransferase [Polyangiaceae bacterium]|nr:class I SAM-dependent methyltransferase [Polyangiaceae bacterium]
MRSDADFSHASQKVIQSITAVWAYASLASGVSLGLFTHIEGGTNTVARLSEATGAPERGLNAILEVLAVSGYVDKRGNAFFNRPETSAVLVAGKPEYLGDFVLHNLRVFEEWGTLPEVVASGVPAIPLRDAPNHPFWESIGQAALPLGIPFAQAASKLLKISGAGPIKILDVAGGTGYFACSWLKDNPEAHATQLDWANMNALAERLAMSWGVGERFTTQAGNSMEVDLGKDTWDYIVYAQMAHGIGWTSNVAVFRRAYGALKAGGSLVIADYLRTDDAPHPFVSLMDVNILIHSADGRVWSADDCRSMVKEAGFQNVTVQSVRGPNSLVVARK